MICRKGHAMSRMGKSFLVVLVFACAALTASTSAQVVINEIHYNPAARVSISNAEFVELYNTGASSVSVAGWSIVDAFAITFPGGTTIPGHGYLVLAKDPAVLQTNTGYAGALQWNVAGGAGGQLSDGGEIITLRNDLAVTVDSRQLRRRRSRGPPTPDGIGDVARVAQPRPRQRRRPHRGAPRPATTARPARRTAFSRTPPTLQS